MFKYSAIKDYYRGFEVFTPCKHMTIYTSNVITLWLMIYPTKLYTLNMISHLILTVNCWEVILSSICHSYYIHVIIGVIIEVYHLSTYCKFPKWGQHHETLPVLSTYIHTSHMFSYMMWITTFSYIAQDTFMSNTAIYQSAIMIFSLLLPTILWQYVDVCLWGSYRLLILGVLFGCKDLQLQYAL